MGYSISLAGDGADPDDVLEVFENAVRALRLVKAEGSAAPTGTLVADGTVTLASTVTDDADPGEAEPTNPDADDGADTHTEDPQ